MSTVRLPPYPHRVLLCHHAPDRHVIWTQEFKSREGGWLKPEDHDASMLLASNQWYHENPAVSITRWAFSRPLDSHFIFVTHLTVSNYDCFEMNDVLKMLDSMPRLEELELCRVNILDNATGPIKSPADMARSLRRLAIEACNITQGLSDAHYGLLFRFLSLFERIERLRLIATLFDRTEQIHRSPGLDSLCLPMVAHLEAEGFSSLVLLAFFQQRYPVRELHSLHLSRCFSSWGNIGRLAKIVRLVSPTLRHLAFRPDLEAQPTRGLARLFHKFTDAVSQCAELREVEFGLYAHSELSISLFRAVLAAVRIGRLKHLAFVLDLGHSQLLSDPDIVPWSELDKELDYVCVEYASEPLEIRIQRCTTGNLDAGYYEDPEFWVKRLPEMHNRVRVVDTVRAERLAVGHYAAPARIDEERIGRVSTSRLRSGFDL